MTPRGLTRVAVTRPRSSKRSRKSTKVSSPARSAPRTLMRSPDRRRSRSSASRLSCAATSAQGDFSGRKVPPTSPLATVSLNRRRPLASSQCSLPVMSRRLSRPGLGQ
ncbi:MAG: hypothetical protein AB9900_06665 [Humidesulfovibrio sp.]